MDCQLSKKKGLQSIYGKYVQFFLASFLATRAKMTPAAVEQQVATIAGAMMEVGLTDPY